MTWNNFLISLFWIVVYMETWLVFTVCFFCTLTFDKTNKQQLVSLAVFLESSRFSTNRTLPSTNTDDLMASILWLLFVIYLLCLVVLVVISRVCWVEAVKGNCDIWCDIWWFPLLRRIASISIFITTGCWPLSNTGHICWGPRSIFILHGDGLSALTLDN